MNKEILKFLNLERRRYSRLCEEAGKKALKEDSKEMRKIFLYYQPLWHKAITYCFLQAKEMMIG